MPRSRKARVDRTGAGAAPRMLAGRAETKVLETKRAAREKASMMCLMFFCGRRRNGRSELRSGDGDGTGRREGGSEE